MDPRLKLQYYEDNDWEDEYILEAKLIVTEIWNNFYKNNIDASQSSDNIDDDLLSHIFKKRKTDRNDELKSYLREPTISKSTNILAWWKVNFIVKFIFIIYNNILLLLIFIDFF